MSQHVLLVINARHEAAVAMAHQVIEGLHRAGMSVTMTDDDALSLHEIPHGVHVVPSGEQAGDGCQLVVVLGGDGTILRGAELARGGDVATLRALSETAGYFLQPGFYSRHIIPLSGYYPQSGGPV